MDFSCVLSQCSGNDHFQIGNPEGIAEIHPFKKVETGVDRNPHLRGYLSSLSGLKSLLDVSFQEAPIETLIYDSPDALVEGRTVVRSGIAIPARNAGIRRKEKFLYLYLA